MKRILVVDDNEALRRPLGKFLEQAGYQVETAADGNAGLKLFRQSPFDLVVTDLIMPGKEGLETIVELRRIQPDLKIIAMSGGGRLDPSNYLPMATLLGATKVLAKPFSQDEIIEAVKSLLNE
jgi:DNA-binding response OmpR family regulator